MPGTGLDYVHYHSNFVMGMLLFTFLFSDDEMRIEELILCLQMHIGIHSKFLNLGINLENMQGVFTSPSRLEGPELTWE